MKQLFLTSVTSPLERWSQAFPDLHIGSTLNQADDDDLVWLDCQNSPAALESLLEELQRNNSRFVVMESSLTDERGLWFMQRGAAGYVHRHATPEQLKDISQVVRRGGVWMGAELLQRALQASLTISRESQRVQPGSKLADVDATQLTARELAVAEQVGKGASNREIAEVLDVSERTVKAHLSVVFEKMQVRDRVQLALLMNNVQI